MLKIVQEALTQMSDEFSSEMNEKKSVNGYVVVRATPRNKEEVKKWLGEFATVSGVGYIVGKVIKSPARKSFREEYICHHSDLKKVVKSTDPRLLEHKHKATGCKQRLYVSIQKTTPDVLSGERRKRENYVARGLIATFTFTGEHNHQVRTADSGRFLRASSTAQENLIDKFRQGHGPASAARELHESRFESAASAAVFPTASQIYYLWDKFQQQEYGGRRNEDVFALLESRLPEYTSDGMQVTFTREPFAIALITPIMRRTADSYDGETMFVDSTSSCDVTNTVLTFLLIETPSGGSPIGAILTQSQSSTAYRTGFTLVQKMFGSKAFSSRGYPLITMTDDSAAERDAVTYVWPQTRLLLCHFHVGQAVWRWLQQRGRVASFDRQHLMSLFRSVMYAFTEEEAGSSMQKVKLFLDEHSYADCMRYFDGWWERRNDWCCAFRKLPALRGHNTNNFAEANIRIFKDIGVNRVKQYNAVSLLHAVMTTMENFYKDRLIQFAYNRNRLNIYKLRNMSKMADYLSADDIIKVAKDVFLVNSSDRERHYEVNVSCGVCSCAIGSDGSFCKHQWGVWNHTQITMPNLPKVCDEDRFVAGRVALGEKCPSKEFFASLRTTDTVSLDLCEEHVNMDVTVSVSDETPTLLNAPAEAEMDIKGNVSRELSEACEELMSRVHALTDANWEELQKSVRVFRQRLNNCTNSSQLTTFLHTVGGGIPRLKRVGAMVPVQPTSKARRAETRSRGNRTLSYGRNAKVMALINKAKRSKVPHKLSENIRHNVSNSRKH